MSKFTREELESMLDALNYIEDNVSWRNRHGWDDALKGKIEAMLANSPCVHEWVSLFVIDEDNLRVLGGTAYKCLQCNKTVPNEWGKTSE